MDADTTSALDYEHAQRLMVPTEMRIGRNGGVGLSAHARWSIGHIGSQPARCW
jgi:hypothetical protein